MCMPELSYTDTGNLRERVVLVTYKAVEWVFLERQKLLITAHQQEWYREG